LFVSFFFLHPTVLSLSPKLPKQNIWQGVYDMDRPRRTTRQPAKIAKALAEPAPRVAAAKRKVDPEQRLNTLLESSKSELVSMELPVRIKST
jgi:hypothetical protein